MKLTRTAVFVSALTMLAVRHADAQLISSPDGLTVYDTIRHVTWLANANLAGTPGGQFGVAGISQNGAMSYQTAVAWVAALNAQNVNGQTGYLGHANWTLPISPTTDNTCSAVGPNGNSFGFGCRRSAMGSLYYLSLGLRYPGTAVPIPSYTFGPFRNLQPYLYWSDTPSGNNDDGYQTFSFNTGYTGSNVDAHYMYALPMIPGKLAGTYTTAGLNDLQVSADGQTVYDPIADVTWLADGALAVTQTFGAQCLDNNGRLCINPDGSMTHSTAKNWVAGMNAYNNGAGWLGHSNWVLPPTSPADATCIPGFFCGNSPMGELFYGQLGLTQGTPVIEMPNAAAGPFYNVQPYLYWSCSAPDSCEGDPPARGFEWSFSLGNGFQGTDALRNNLYVMVYCPESPGLALAEAITSALGANARLPAFLSQAAALAAAPDAGTKSAILNAFISNVNAQRGIALSAAQADQLIALAQAN